MLTYAYLPPLPAHLGFEPQPLDPVIVVIELTYPDSSALLYQLPLAVSQNENAAALLTAHPNSILLQASTGRTALHDATVIEAHRQAILATIQQSSILPARSAAGIDATVSGRPSNALTLLDPGSAAPSRLGSAEQSNTSILYGSSMILKLFRRLEPGANPDIEIGRFLTEVARFERIPPYLGQIELLKPEREPTSLGMLQGLVRNEGDGWEWTLHELSRFYHALALQPAAPPPATSLTPQAQPCADSYAEAAALLGRRTAEVHVALAVATEDPNFRSELLTAEDLAADALRIGAQIDATLATLQVKLDTLDESTAAQASALLARREDLHARARTLGSQQPTGRRIRIHGDYHLGQVLRTLNDFVLLDFEGEPARTLAERRRKQSPLRDVAGMLRSFSYAAAAGLDLFNSQHPGPRMPPQWAHLWQNAASSAFLSGYWKVMLEHPALLPRDRQTSALLSAYLLEKALYELLYELNNRPAWVAIPLAGILDLAQ